VISKGGDIAVWDMIKVAEGVDRMGRLKSCSTDRGVSMLQCGQEIGTR